MESGMLYQRSLNVSDVRHALTLPPDSRRGDSADVAQQQGGLDVTVRAFQAKQALGYAVGEKMTAYEKRTLLGDGEKCAKCDGNITASRRAALPMTIQCTSCAQKQEEAELARKKK